MVSVFLRTDVVQESYPFPHLAFLSNVSLASDTDGVRPSFTGREGFVSLVHILPRQLNQCLRHSQYSVNICSIN